MLKQNWVFTFKQNLKQVVIFWLSLFSDGSNLRDRASILMYHSVGENKAFFTVKKANLERQLEYLHKQNFKVILLSELIKKIHRREDISRNVVITCDDGFKDFYTTFFPLLKKFNFKATVFIATGFIGASFTNSEGIRLPTMTRGELSELQYSGLVELMPHAHTHPDFDRIKFEVAQDEIKQSVDVLTSVTGQTKDLLFSFPRGRYTQEILEYLRSTQIFIGAVSVTPGLVRTGSDLFCLPRNPVDSLTSFLEFKSKFSNVIEHYNFFKKCLK